MLCDGWAFALAVLVQLTPTGGVILTWWQKRGTKDLLYTYLAPGNHDVVRRINDAWLEAF